MPDKHDRHGRPRQVYRAARPAGEPRGNGDAQPTKPRTKQTARAAAASTNGTGFGAFFRKNQRNILVGGAILLLIVVLLLVMLIPSCSTKEPDSSIATSIASEPELLDNTDYDKDAYVVPLEEYQGTILEETEDAGQDYVDDTLFLGDSNTVRMLNYRDVTGVSTQNAVGVVGMGIQSVTSYKCVKYQGLSGLVTMPEAVAVTQPRRVVITFGTNNVGGMGVDTFIGHYEDALAAIREEYEYADIIIGAVFPVDANCSANGITMAKIDQYNVSLAELADREDCKFLYWSEALRGDSGFAVGNYTVSDGYHVSRDGMEALFDYFRTHAYIGEDNRPKPLKDVPARLDADVDLITRDGNTDTVPGQPVSMPTIEEEPEPVVEPASVIYSVWDDTLATTGGGSLSIDGGSYSGYTYECNVGDMAPGVTAVPAEGYRFAYWSASIGIDTGSPSVGSFTVSSTTITLTAIFESTLPLLPEGDIPSVPEDGTEGLPPEESLPEGDIGVGVPAPAPAAQNTKAGGKRPWKASARCLAAL